MQNQQELPLQHCCLKVRDAIIQGVGGAINKVYYNPIARLDLVWYLLCKRGEESNKDDMLVPVRSVGGSGICSHFEGGLGISLMQVKPRRFFVRNCEKIFRAGNSGIQ